MPINPISNETKSTITVLSNKSAQTQIAKDAAQQVAANSLSAVDTYVRTTNRMEGAVLGLFNSYVNTQTAMDPSRSATDYTNVLGSVKRAATQRAVTSTVRNAYHVIRGNITIPEAGGRVVGDVSSAAIVSGVSSTITNLAVFGLSKAGASSFPILAGGMIAGYVADRVVGKQLIKHGVQQTITTKATEVFQKIADQIGGGKEEAPAEVKAAG